MAPMAASTDRASGARVWGVGALVQAVGDSLATRFGACMVRGELSGCVRAASGHAYFTLKDEHGQAALRCAMFRRAFSQVEFAPADGMLVEVRGQLAVYEARGELQLVVDAMRPAGAGALYEQFLRLKARLESLGLFDASRKRTLGACPRRIAVVTSPAAAAWHDVMVALARRVPHVEVVLVPTAVQGPEAPAQIVQAFARLSLAHRQGQCLDAVVLCRGGGSLEDLWAFNDERVVHAVAGCPVPVVCGVGHETDLTLADLAADVRAPTPTAAAELVATDLAALEARLNALSSVLLRRCHQRIDAEAQRLDRWAWQLGRPAQGLGAQRQRCSLLSHRLVQAQRMALQHKAATLQQLQLRWQHAAQRQWPPHHHRLERLADRLEALSPARVLERGYAWLADTQGAPITRVAQAVPGEAVRAVLADGVLHLNVSEVQPDPASAA